ncbi:MAG: outer membrane protein assembly factor BamD [Gammaproteobacteria bacterium]
MRLMNLHYFALLLFILAGCAAAPATVTSQAPQRDSAKDWSDVQLYNDGKAALLEGDYERASGRLETLTLRYPLAGHTQQALLDAATGIRQHGQSNAAVDMAEQFIAKNPNHPNVDYAYYERGLIAFQDGIATLEAVKPANATPQDSAQARRAFQYFAELLQGFPTSRFAKDAAQRMLLLRNTMAQHELNMAKYFLEQGDRSNAAARAKYILDNYQQSPVIADALSIMTRANAPQIDKTPQPPILAQPTAPAPAALPSQPATAAATQEIVARNTTPPDRGDTIQRESWLLAQNPAHYTIQLSSMTDEAALINFIKKTDGLQRKASYFRGSHGMYSLLYGIYPTEDAAKEATRDLPKNMYIAKPWVRGIRGIHESIKKAGSAR